MARPKMPATLPSPVPVPQSRNKVQGLLYDLRELAEAKLTNQKMGTIIPIERRIPRDADEVLDSCQAYIAQNRELWPREVRAAAFDDLAHARYVLSQERGGR